MNNRILFVGYFSFFASVLFVTGCENSKEATVSGQVTLDGNLLDCGSVTFIAGSKTEGKAAAGGIGTDGSYQVQIGQSGKLWVGEYVVKVSAREAPTPHPEGGPPTPGALITPERYAATSTSGLRYNIRSGENVIDIALVSQDSDAVVEPAAAEEPVTEEAEAVEDVISDDDAEETLTEVSDQDGETTIEESKDTPEENAEVLAE